MRIMIFGDVASGKSSFATKLGAELGLPVIHLDEIMTNTGRHQSQWGEIEVKIKQKADKSAWVMDGNAFNKDKDYRIQRADLIIIFDAPRIVTFGRYLRRYLRIRLGLDHQVGGHSTQLKLGYYAPYIFKHFPNRKRAAIERAKASGKPVHVVRSWQQAQELMAQLAVS
jgi:adenylate kinase family enzyme